MKIIERVDKFIEEEKLLDGASGILLGVSGGADSVAMLLLLRELAGKYDLPIEVLHVEHGIRGQESLDDAAFVERLCWKLSVPFHMVSVDAISYSKAQGLSLEEAARNLRYIHFGEYASSMGPNTRIAIAHNANDNAETVLFQLIRGTGIRGLCGIAPRQGQVIRPLLILERDEILEYLDECKQDFRVDSTNSDTAFGRNAIRADVLPRLQEINAQAISHINHSSALLRAMNEDMEEETKRALLDCLRDDEDLALGGDRKPGQRPLSIQSLLELEEGLRRRVLHEWLIENTSHARDIGAVHLSEIETLLTGQTGRGIDLPYGCRVEREYDLLRITHKSEADVKDCKLDLTIPPLKVGERRDFSLDSGWLEVSLLEANTDQMIPKNIYTKWFDYDKIGINLKIRTRRPGDFLVVSASGGRKKLKDYYIDEKIPREERENMPLLALGDEILWVIGYRRGESFMVDSSTEHILQVRFWRN